MTRSDPKHIVITGVTKGLGYQMAKHFIRIGHRVSGCGRSADIIDGMKQEFNGNHIFTSLDISKDRDVGEWVSDILLQSGAPEILINNGAMMNHPNPLWKISDDEFSDMVQINILGTQNMIRHVVPAMIRRKSGIIINFSSGWGRSAAPEVGPYCATKWAIEGLTKSLSQELPQGLAAVSLNPGIIYTDMLERCWPGSASQFETPEQWAEKAIPFILGISTHDNGCEMTVS